LKEAPNGLNQKSAACPSDASAKAHPNHHIQCLETNVKSFILLNRLMQLQGRKKKPHSPAFPLKSGTIGVAYNAISKDFKPPTLTMAAAGHGRALTSTLAC